MSRRRFLRPVTVTPLVALMAAACTVAGSGDTSSSKSTASGGTLSPKGSIEVVSFYPKGSPDYQRLAGFATAFEKKYPGTTVNLVFGGGQDTPKIQARWRAGNPPEVNDGFFDGTSEQGRRYAQAGQVLPLDPYLNQPLAGYGTTWGKAFLPAVSIYDTSPVNGKTYAVPDAITTIQLFYNKKIFQQQGLTPPKTLADLFTAADKIKAAGIAPFAVTGTFAPYMQLWYDYLLLRRSGKVNVEAALGGTKDFAALPGVMDAANDLEKMVKSGYFLNGFQSTDFTAAQLNFFQGKAAMILMGSWLIGEMKQSIPAGFQVGTFPFPAVPGAGGDQQAIFGGVNNEVVAAQSKNPTGGVAWLKFLGQKDNQVLSVKQTGTLSGYRDVPPPPGFENVLPSLNSKNAFVPSYWGILSQPQAVIDAYDKPISRLFFGQINAAQMVSQINEGLRKANAAG